MDTMTEHLYVEVAGTTGYVGGERGTVKMLDFKHGARAGAFFALDERPAMLYVTLGGFSGDRNQHAEVASYREITRDEFDDLTGLAQARREMGWTL